MARPPQLFQLAWTESMRTLELLVTVAPLVSMQLAECSKARPRKTTLLRPTTLIVFARDAASMVAVEGSVPDGGQRCSVPSDVLTKNVPDLRSESLSTCVI